MFDNFKVANYPKSLVSPELYARPLARLFSGDVIDGLTVTPGTGLQVVLAPGNAMIRYGSAAVASARIASLVANFNLTIETADVSNPRIDLVVLYIDNAVNLPDGTPSAANLDGKGVAKAKIVKGTAAATPAAPNGTAIQASVGAGNPYTVLAQVRVNAGVSVIAANQISDVRNLARTAKIDPGTTTTLTGNMSTVAMTTAGAVAATVTLPTSNIPMKYLILATFNLNNAGFNLVRDMYGEIRRGATVLREAQTTATAGSFVSTAAANVIVTSSGENITFAGKISAAGASPVVLATSHYSVVALGPA